MSSDVAGWRASHVPGRWPVLMGPTSLVVVDPSARTDLTALWQRILDSASMAELVTTLAAISPADSPDLLALFWSSDGMRSLVRGNLRLLDPATAEVVADGAGMLTWREVGLDGRELLELDLGSGPVGDRGLPLVVGAVHAGALRIEAGAGASVISSQSLTGTGEAVPAQQAAPAVADEAPLESSEIDLVAAGAVWPPPHRTPVAVPALATAAGAAPAGAPGAALPPTATSGRTPAEDEADLPLGESLTRRTSPPTPAEPATDSAVEEPDTDPAVEEMENGDTELMAPATEASVPVPDQHLDQPGGTPLVPAAICLSGHPNPPGADRCPLCEAPVPPQSARLVPRPVLGVLRSPDGVSRPIDRPVLVGRAPVLRDDLAEVPELMRVPSPGQDISRTHLLVTPDEWEILLTDLHSTNGTVIVRPGPGVERLQLQPGEPLAVTVGTVVELGDGVALLVDGPPRPNA